MSIISNSSLNLFRHCPPGLGDDGCREATCNSTFIAPASRSLKPSNAQTCSVCDAGFGGLNCNVCQGINSCSNRQKASGRGISGVETSSSSSTLIQSSINHTLTCDTQPAPVTASYYECDIEQPTLSALFPGRFLLTGINVANTPNFTATGVKEWDVQANSSYISVFLDGTQQFSCGATDCASSNITNAVGGSMAPHGTSLWSCSSFECSCVPGTRVCTGSTIPLGSIIDSLNGTLDLPCNYADPTNPAATTQCAFSSAMLNQFVGPSGLSLTKCQFGQCLAQRELDDSWQASSLAAARKAGDHLSGSVIAGLVVLGSAALFLLPTAAYGFWLRHSASKRHRQDSLHAIGLSWEAVEYRVAISLPRWVRGKGRWTASSAVAKEDGKHFDTNVELATFEHESGSRSEQSCRPSSRFRHVLRGITSYASPGSLTFIIGPSGSGKTSLVDILAGRKKRGQVSGSLSWLGDNKVEVAVGGTQRHIAYVDQDDSVCIPSYLKVREALRFAARLGAPEYVSTLECNATVEDTLQTLGLIDIAEHQIGDARRRGISGGERRRVSLGIALVSRPRILIADECTSGLDAVSALRVVEALRRLASGPSTGTTVIMTMHQPSSQVFHMADHSIVLASGSIVFDGQPSTALDFCQKAGIVIPPGHNVADHLLTLAFQRTAGNMSSHNQSQSQLSAPYDHPDGVTTANGMHEKHDSVAGWERTPLAINHGGDRPVTTFMTQLIALVQRMILATKREMLGPAAHIVGTALLSIFIGACYYQVSLSLGGFQNRVGSLFFIYILLLFTGLSAITGLAKVRLLMMRERACGFYSPWSWVAAHLLYDLILLRAVPSIILVVIVYWMVGLRHSAAAFFEFMLITVIFNWIVATYGMVLAALVEDVSVAILLGALYVLFNLAFAGFIMNHNSTPKAVSWLQWLVPTKYALEAVASNELKGRLLVDNISGVPVQVQVSLFTQRLFGFQENSYYRDLIVLSCGFLLGYSAILFASVWWRMREMR